MSAAPTSLEFFRRLVWLDGRPLLETMEPYRRRLFARALDDRLPNGALAINLVLSGRAKKNNKSTDLVLAGIFCTAVRTSIHGNDSFILANDEDQAGDDLSLAKKLVAVNPELAELFEVRQKEIIRRDGLGSLQILPARDAVGAHGKTGCFVGFDEIHGYRTYDLLEALAPDPTRDTLTWITSYDTIYNSPGVPLVDYKRLGQSGTDPRMLFSWYSGDLCTDPDFAELPPEQRANPSMGSWPDGTAYLEQQRRRLPTHKFRRLHLNMPGAPNGAFLDQGAVMAAIVSGRQMLAPRDGLHYFGFVDMSGGSGDDAVVAIGHDEDGVAVVDVVQKQLGETPFNPRHAVERFATTLKSYRVSTVHGDDYAGLTFAQDFEGLGITFRSSARTKTEIYEAFEPALNAGEVELLDQPKLQEQLLTLVVRGARVDHEPNGHDDWANAAAGVVCVIRDSRMKCPEIDLGVGCIQVSAPYDYDGYGITDFSSGFGAHS